MKNYKFKLIYGEFKGVEKRAVETISQTLSDYINYPLPTVRAEDVLSDLMPAESLTDYHLVVVGTIRSNPLLKMLVEQSVYRSPEEEEGYCIKVMESIFNPEAQMVLITGADARGVLYGAVDFAAYYVPYAENSHDPVHYFREIFMEHELPEYEKYSAPSICKRGIWTWGHVIYDYKKYIQNMVRLKMNTLIIWNDHVPVNIADIIEEAHSYGVQIYLGFSWGWNEARSEINSVFDISDDKVLYDIGEKIIQKYDTSYAVLDIDGIYFQSFTETQSETSHNVVIAERVVSLVNRVADVLFERKPDLALMFGLHATSVSKKLEYIRKTDERIMIVWEDCGAFPYAYAPNRIEDFDKACEFTKKIAVLRGENDNFGVVTKGISLLDWTSFEHQTAPYIMGEQSEQFVLKRAEEKKKLWNYIDAYWMKNAGYAYEMIQLLKESNQKVMITGLIEDGLFEAQIHMACALYGEMMWDTDSDLENLKLRVSLRKDVD